MKIALVITRADDLGGAQVHLLKLATTLAKRGQQTAVFAGTRGALSELLEEEGVPFREISSLARSINPLRDFAAVGELTRALSDFGPDLVASHSSKAGAIARLVAFRLGVPSVFTAHGWSFTPGPPFHKRLAYLFLEGLLARCGEKIITVSEFDRRLALRYRLAAPDRIVTIRNGVEDLAGEEYRAAATKEPPQLISVARYSDQKDHRTLFLALAELKHLDWTLQLLGDGPKRNEVEALARALGMSQRIEFLGLRRDVAHRLAQSQIFLLISNWEGLPISILEAMRAGMPVIASDVGGVGPADQQSQAAPGDGRSRETPVFEALSTFAYFRRDL